MYLVSEGLLGKLSIKSTYFLLKNCRPDSFPKDSPDTDDPTADGTVQGGQIPILTLGAIRLVGDHTALTKAPHATYASSCSPAKVCGGRSTTFTLTKRSVRSSLPRHTYSTRHSASPIPSANQRDTGRLSPCRDFCPRCTYKKCVKLYAVDPGTPSLSFRIWVSRETSKPLIGWAHEEVYHP